MARVCALRDHHVPDLPWRQAQVLILQAIGVGDSEVAATLEIRVATAQGMAYAARRAVVPDGYASDDGKRCPLLATRRNATAWAWIHRRCCTATAFSAMQFRESAEGARLTGLSGHAFPSLDGDLSLVASLIACGFEDVEIANAMAVSTATVRRRQRAIVDAFAIEGVALDPNEAAAAMWLHGDCCSALPAEVLDATREVLPAPHHASPHPARRAPISAFLRRARLAPLIAAMWIGASMGAVIGKRRRVQAREEMPITALVRDAPPHVAPKDP